METGIDFLKGKHIAQYARVSTSDKDQNPENQLLPMRLLCQKAGAISNLEDEYIEFETAANSKELEDLPRPVMQHVYDLLASGKYDGIMTVRPDRAFRNRTDWGIYLRKLLKLDKFIWFQERGRAIDRNTKKTDLSALGFEFEAVGMFSAILSDAVKGAVVRKRSEAEAQGKPFEWGKKKTRYKGKALVSIDKYKVIEMYKLGGTVRSIALELNVGRGRIWEIIKNRNMLSIHEKPILIDNKPLKKGFDVDDVD